MIADRVAAFALVLGGDGAGDVLGDLGRLHYDLAGFPVPRQLDAPPTITTLEHLHYGSDYPFTPEFVVERAATLLDDGGRVPSSWRRTAPPCSPGGTTTTEWLLSRRG